jgi:histidine triad (HIT) family protein
MNQKTLMKECIFCQIVSGESPSSIFYEDDLVLGLMTIGPVTTGHTMIIPKEHAAYLADLNEEVGRHLWTITQRTAAAIRESGVRCEGINLFLADGKAAFQEVFHLHMHIFPRYEGDSFELVSDWNVKPPRNELDLVSNKIKVAYDRLWRRFDKEGS